MRTIKYKIGDKVYIIGDYVDNQFEIKERYISGLNTNCREKTIKYNLKNKSNYECEYGEHYEVELFESELKAKKYITKLIQKAKFKINDLVKKKKEKSLYFIKKYELDYENTKMNYHLGEIFNRGIYYNSTKYNDIQEKELMKIDLSSIADVLEFERLEKELKEIENKRDEKIKEIINLQNKLEKDYNYCIKIKSSWYSSFFKTKKYKIAKLLFGGEK